MRRWINFAGVIIILVLAVIFWPTPAVPPVFAGCPHDESRCQKCIGTFWKCPVVNDRPTCLNLCEAPEGYICTNCDVSGCCGDPDPDCGPYCPPPPPPTSPRRPPTATPIPTPTATPTPRIVTVSGTVYNGSGGGSNKCVGFGVTPFKPGGGSKVSVNPDGREGPVEGNGTYQANQVVETGAKTITLTGIDPGYYCSCPGSCQYSANLQISGVSGWDFYVSNILSKWAQAAGGHVHGNAGARVEVPAGRYFLIKADFSNNPGAATKAGGDFITFPGSLSTTNWKLTDPLVQTSWRYSYHRLWVRAGSPTQDPGDGSIGVPEPGIYRKTGDYSVNSSGWQNLSGSRVIFVDGDLNIKSKIGLAGAGDFLAFIVSGDINVNPTVGDSAVANPTPSNADLAGAFLANGNFNGGTNTSGNDKQLVIYGTVAADMDLNGAGRVRFQRNMGANNAVGPGVSVIWNPNLLLNWPAQLSDALTDWREAAP